MQLKTHHLNNNTIGEVIADTVIIENADQGIDLVGELCFSGFDHAIIHSRQFSPDFFDLSTGMAGEILQKFSTYRIRLAIVTNPETKRSKSLDEFILESNRFGHINFVTSVDEALEKFK